MELKGTKKWARLWRCLTATQIYHNRLSSPISLAVNVPKESFGGVKRYLRFFR